MRKASNRNNRAFGYAIATGLWAFLLAALAGFISQSVIKEITVIFLAFILLIVVIVVGIIFDIVGVAVTAANEKALHARAAGRVFGAVQAARLVRNASKVASFCNDLAGDVSGTLSGAIGVTILFKILVDPSELVSVWSATLMTALIAALVVGGKAYGKTFAVSRGTEIIFRVGQLIAWLKKPVQSMRLISERKGG